ncbi:MAG: MBL fold metallo-hydrolase [Planctomycetota bacterium]
MKIVLLGAGGYHPNSRRHTACVMLPELGVVFDAGTGAFRIPQHLATDRLDIFLSHTHLDHVFGLTSLIGLFEGDDAARLTVHGEPAKLDTVRDHLFSPLLFPVEPNFTTKPLQPTVEVAGARITSFPLVGHPGGTIGFRLDMPGPGGGKSMAYVTDTIADPEAAYVERLSGVDLLIHEAYFDEDRRDFANLTGHSCLPDVVDIAATAGVKRLVLVHMNPREDRPEPLDLTEARRRIPAITLGNDGDSFEL